MLISELAERTGLSTRALRHYEDRGLLVPERNSNGYRIFGDDDITSVAQIKAMIAAGLGTREIRQYLGCVRTDGDTHSITMVGSARNTMSAEFSASSRNIDSLRISAFFDSTSVVASRPVPTTPTIAPSASISSEPELATLPTSTITPSSMATSAGYAPEGCKTKYTGN